MASNADRIKGLLEEKISLYGELVALLKAEKTSIVAMDLPDLWKSARNKEAVAARIEAIRREVLALVEVLSPLSAGSGGGEFRLSGVLSRLPKEDAKALMPFRSAARRLRSEVRALAGENRKYVQEYQGVLDGMITTMTAAGKGAGGRGKAYGRSGAVRAIGGYPAGGGGNSSMFNARA